MDIEERFSLKSRLYMLLLICVVPLTILLAYLLIMTNKISSEYDRIVRRITKANAYNINFKEDMDYVMYIIVVNSSVPRELVDGAAAPDDTAAREVFGELYEEADSGTPRTGCQAY